MQRGYNYVIIVLAAGLLLIGVSHEVCARQKRQTITDTSGRTEYGLAAVYSNTLQGRRTASGTRFDQRQPMVAHKRLPLGTRVKLTNPSNHRSIVAVVTDRGPRQRGRIVDMTRHIARELNFGPTGLMRVRLEVVAPPRRVHRT